MTFQVSQILFDMHVPVRLKTFAIGAFLVRRMKWYQICPSRLSYYFVSNEEEGCRISFLGILWTDFLLECQEVEGAAWEKRELRPPVQSPASFITCPGMGPPHPLFLWGCLFSYIETWVSKELMLCIPQRKLSLIQSKQEWSFHSQNKLSASHRKESLKTLWATPFSQLLRTGLWTATTIKVHGTCRLMLP